MPNNQLAPADAVTLLGDAVFDPERMQTRFILFRHEWDGRRVPLAIGAVPVTPGHREMTLATPELFTRDEWLARSPAARLSRMVSFMVALPNGDMTTDDMTLVLPGSTLAYLEYWQKQWLTGEPWWAGTAIGETANRLLERGYLLHARKRIRNAHGNIGGTRYKEPQGDPGTDAFVLKTMGPEYLRWLKAIVE